MPVSLKLYDKFNSFSGSRQRSGSGRFRNSRLTESRHCDCARSFYGVLTGHSQTDTR